MPKTIQPLNAENTNFDAQTATTAHRLPRVEIEGVTYDEFSAKIDGEGFFRCASMWMSRTVMDDDIKNHKMRQDKLAHAAKAIAKAKGGRAARNEDARLQ